MNKLNVSSSQSRAREELVEDDIWEEVISGLKYFMIKTAKPFSETFRVVTARLN